MFDKITIRAKVSDDECVHLARIHRLHVWLSEDGKRVEYRSSQYSKFTGIEVRIVRNVATLKVSLHKFWNERSRGFLRNDNLFTMSEAKKAFAQVLFENGFLPEKVRVVYFEIGLNLPVTYDPLTFMERVKSILCMDKIMFVDANYRVNRQKTTEKHKDIRRYFKIYDKGWENKEKRRGPLPLSEGVSERDDYVLRVETVYKRHSESGKTFFSDKNVARLADRFYVEWKDLFFVKNINAHKGAKKSEVERAKLIVNSSSEEYMARVRAEYDDGKMTAKQYRTIREFVRDFEANAHRFKVIISAQEREYKRLLMQEFRKAKL